MKFFCVLILFSLVTISEINSRKNYPEEEIELRFGQEPNHGKVKPYENVTSKIHDLKIRDVGISQNEGNISATPSHTGRNRLKQHSKHAGNLRRSNRRPNHVKHHKKNMRKSNYRRNRLKKHLRNHVKHLRRSRLKHQKGHHMRRNQHRRNRLEYHKKHAKHSRSHRGRRLKHNRKHSRYWRRSQHGRNRRKHDPKIAKSHGRRISKSRKKPSLIMIKNFHPEQKRHQPKPKVNSGNSQSSSLPKGTKLMRSGSPVTNSSTNVTIQEEQGCDTLDVEIFTDEITHITRMVTPKFNRSDPANQKWYTFLDELYSKLSQYEIQKAICKYNVANLKDWGTYDKPQGINISHENVEEFFEIVSNFDLENYRSIQEKNITNAQLDELNHILNITLNYKTTILCLRGKNNSLVVKSNYIRLGDLDFNVCSQKNKYIKLYALDTVFIDQDFEVKILTDVISLQILAPKWSIIGKRKVRLIGAHQTHVYKNEANKDKPEGQPGAPGLPGHPGGNFFGFGNDFQNIENLTVDVSGGNGGGGQKGGMGEDGDDGVAVYKPNLYPVPKDLCKDKNDKFAGQGQNHKFYNFECERSLEKDNSSSYIHHCGAIEWNAQCLSAWWNFWACTAKGCCRYYIFGTEAENGWKGGDGGAGGIAGSPGNILVVSNYTINFTSIKQQGKQGRKGLGNRGGEGGKRYASEWLVCNWFKSADWILVQDKYVVSQSPAGYSGHTGKNKKNIQKPATPEAIYPTAIFVDYKLYLIETSYDRYRRPFLRKFLDWMEEKTIHLMTTEELLIELETLEEKYYTLNTKIDFLPFYQSLLNRIQIHAEKTMDPGHKKALNFLFVATVSKINSFNPDTVLIKNVNEYFRVLLENFKHLQNLKKENNKLESVVNNIKKIDSEKQNYVESINLLIKEGRILVEDQIFPEFDRIGKEIDQNIQSLLSEVTAQKAKLKQELSDLKKKEAELKFWGPFKIFFTIIKNIVAPLVSAVAGPVAGAFVGAAAGIGESLTNVETGPITKSKMSSNIANAQKELSKIKNTKIQEIKRIEKLSVTFKIDINLKPFLNKIKNSKSFKEMERIAKSGYEKFAEVTSKMPNLPKSFSVNLNSALAGGGAILDIVDDAKSLGKKLDQMGEAIKEKEEEIKQAEQFERDIVEQIGPMLQNMVDDVKDTARNLEGKSLMTLDVTKYEVKKTIEQMKFQMEKTTQGFEMTKDLSESLKNLENAFTTLIGLYDRIQSYQEHQKFASYIATLMTAVASDIPIPSELEVHMSYLEVLISSNLIKQQLKTAFDSIKQFVFPLAHMYFANFIMPSSMKLESSIENLAFESMKQVSYIKSQLDEYNYAIKEYDGAFATGWFNSDYDDSQPFFIWNNEEHKFAISQILSGRETILKANIIKSTVRFDAVKFKFINIRLKLRNARSQKKLDKILKGFSVSLIHMGDSYFRFKSKVYLIQTKSLELWYSYETTLEGDPVYKNEVYRKLNNGDFMLSPFATWQVKLDVIPENKNNFSFAHLEKYKDAIDIELGGIGFFLRPDKIPRNKKLYVSNYYQPVEHIYTAKTKREVDEEKLFNYDSWYPNTTRTRF